MRHNIFRVADREIPFSEHAHSEHWTVVLQGSCAFTAEGKARVYKKGDTYNIPGGMLHQITLHSGYAELHYTLYEKQNEKVKV